MRQRPWHRLLLVLTVIFIGAGQSACSDDGAPIETVIGTENACSMDHDVLTAGMNGFKFINETDEVSGLYVRYGDRQVATAAEDVAPGESFIISADLVAGDYQVNCKPGMTGKGFTSTFTVTGEGGYRDLGDRKIAFDAVDFDYENLDLSDITSGSSIRFEMTNTGDQAHTFEVVDASGDAIGWIGSTEPGETGVEMMHFASRGKYFYRCTLVDAQSGKLNSMLGMNGSFTVTYQGP